MTAYLVISLSKMPYKHRKYTEGVDEGLKRGTFEM